MFKTILLLSFSAALCSADVLYSNTTNDQQFSVFYSASGLTQIGDQLQLVSQGTLASVGAQFYNDGADATFDAVLQFYAVGGPEGDEIGSSYVVTGVSIAGNTSQTVTFSGLDDLAVPENVIATLSVLNVSAGGDIGVNFFDPPTVGSSDNSFFIANDGTGFSQASTYLGIDNAYLEVDGTATPEPSTAGMMLGAVALLGVWHRRRK